MNSFVWSWRTLMNNDIRLIRVQKIRKWVRSARQLHMDCSGGLEVIIPWCFSMYYTAQVPQYIPNLVPTKMPTSISTPHCEGGEQAMALTSPPALWFPPHTTTSINLPGFVLERPPTSGLHPLFFMSCCSAMQIQAQKGNSTVLWMRFIFYNLT